jgi:prevent-host-death family protein
MSAISITELRERFSDWGDRASSGERVIVERRGKPLFALVPVEDAEFMERLEDEQDREARGL